MKRLFGLTLAIILLVTNITYVAAASKSKDSEYITYGISVPIYCYDSSNILLPSDLNVKSIIGISVSKGDAYIQAQIDIYDDFITITPMDYFEHDQEYTIKIFTSNKNHLIMAKAIYYKSEDIYDGKIITISPKSDKGFNFPYYIYLPDGMERTKSDKKRLIVEPNNTGYVSDSNDFHSERAKRDASANGAPGHYAAYELKYPFLVPAFPRPYTNWWESYTHALDKGAMMLEGEAKRLDLQLIAMIEDAKEILGKMGYKMEDKVFMTGFSASGQFVNRFATLHPEKVKAIAVGNFTMYPTAKLNGVTLNYPWGIADIKNYIGTGFNRKEYDKIAQFCYIGDQDQNDRPYNVDYGISEEETKAVNDLFGYDYGVPKWERKWEFVKQLGYDKSIQFHVYKGIGHEISYSMMDDIVAFFKANNGDKIVKITPHSSAY